MMIHDYEFWSKECRFGIRLPANVVSQILRQAQKVVDHETGGILIGRYNNDHSCAHIDQATGPPNDSRAARSWFVRGISGLQVLLNRIWQTERRYYIGEWHYHPSGSPVPSHVDNVQMAKISSSEEYACPEPVLLILGGDPNALWEFRAFVFPRGEQPMRLASLDSSSN